MGKNKADNVNLTPKQLLFIDNYINNNGNGYQAYIEAGYSGSSENVVNAAVSRMLKNVNISTEITRRKAKTVAKVEKNLDIDRNWLIAQYCDVIEKASQPDTKQYNVVKSAIDSIAHVTGLWIDKKELSAQLSIDANLNSLDTGELLQALQQAKQPEAIEGEYKTLDA